jgi:hypothetical protein
LPDVATWPEYADVLRDIDELLRKAHAPNLGDGWFHDARIIRDAEVAEPGIVLRAKSPTSG